MRLDGKSFVSQMMVKLINLKTGPALSIHCEILTLSVRCFVHCVCMCAMDL